MALLHIGDAVSFSAPESWRYAPDDRQQLIQVDGGNVVEDYGHIASGDKITVTAKFDRANFEKIYDYNIFRQKAHGFNRGMNATCM